MLSAEALSAVWLSMRVAAFATAINALIGIPLAWVLARHRFRGRGLVDLLVTLPLVLPPTVTGYYLIVLLGRRGWLGAPLYAVTGWSIARVSSSEQATIIKSVATPTTERTCLIPISSNFLRFDRTSAVPSRTRAGTSSRRCEDPQPCGQSSQHRMSKVRLTENATA